MTQSPNLEQSIAEALRGRGQIVRSGPTETVAAPDPKQQKAARTPKRLANVCDAIAAEIQETGQTVVNIANTIAAESEALAELLHKHGTEIEARIEAFMSMSDRVKDRMRAAHDDMLTTSGSGPSLAPQAEPGDDENPQG